MISPDKISPNFQQYLIQQGFPVEDIVADMRTAPKGEAKRVLATWTRLPNKELTAGLENEERDILQPQIATAIAGILDPWITTQTVQNLPSISAIELERKTGIAARKIVEVLGDYPFPVGLNGSVLSATFQKPEFSKSPYNLKDSSKFNLSPKKTARKARYQSRKPGGGPVQKSAIQKKKINESIRLQAYERTLLIFIPQTQPEVALYQENVIFQSENQRTKPITELLPIVEQTLAYFDSLEQNKKGIPARDVLAERLTDLANGKSVPFVIFNCIGFSFDTNKPGQYPTASPELDYPSIADFYKSQIVSIVKMLQQLGEANVTILVPDSEFDRRVINLSLSEDELTQSAQLIKQSLTTLFADTPISIKLLSEYLQGYGLPSPKEYTEINYRNIIAAKRIKDKDIASESAYFVSKSLSAANIEKIPDEVIRDRLAWYYGMYAGEGQALQDSGAIVINLEDDSRVTTWLQRGASGCLDNSQRLLPIITPVVTKDFSQWKKARANLKDNN